MNVTATAVIIQYGILVYGLILMQILKMALEREAGVQPPSIILHTSLVKSVRVIAIIDPTISQLVWPTGLYFEYQIMKINYENTNL